MNQLTVIANICGGLGNQLFCYVAARRLCAVNHFPLKLDIVSGFKKDQYQREYLLHQFNIQAEIASAIESFDYAGGRFFRKLLKKANPFIKFENRFYIKEESPYYLDSKILTLKPNCSLYMEGYWHSEKYFKDIEHIIRSDLKIIAPHEPLAIQEAEQIKNVQNPVCLGIRQFQEVTKPGAHLVLPLEYYLKAIAKIAEQIANPHFFIFCNDQKWAEAHLQLSYPHTFITAKLENDRAYEDLWLMSLCRHFIIPNSTYHWWGAWLSENKNKIVIAPEKGFYNRDIIPDGWLKM